MLVLIPLQLAESIFEAAMNTYPREFIALIEGKKVCGKVILQKLVVLPSTFGNNFSSIRLDLLPIGHKIVASVHSHPNGNLTPSKQDLAMFSRLGLVNLIVDPLNKRIKAFDTKGVELKLSFLP